MIRECACPEPKWEYGFDFYGYDFAGGVVITSVARCKRCGTIQVYSEKGEGNAQR